MRTADVEGDLERKNRRQWSQLRDDGDRPWGQVLGNYNVTGAEEEHVVLLEFLSWNRWGLVVFFSSLIEVWLANKNYFYLGCTDLI